MTDRHYSYYICDVFTTERFGGNALAVLPDAEGLTDREMQQIAREFNFSESTFVLPANKPYDRRLRIFTPATEVPFAGHPNVGTACVLVEKGLLAASAEPATFQFDEKAGEVELVVSRRGGRSWCEVQAPQALSRGHEVEPQVIAEALSLEPDDIVTRHHAPQVASVGLPFLFVELADRRALERATVNMPALGQLRDRGIVPDVHAWLRSNDDFDIRARMFAPFDGVPEDPATGSANCALAALLADCDPDGAKEYSFRIAQGVEMGRPSVLDTRSRRNADGSITAWVGGHSVLVAEGVLHLGPA